MKYNNRVLIILPHLSIGGTENQTLNTAQALVANGYDVTVLCIYRHISSVVEAYRTNGIKVMLLSPQYNNYGMVIRYHKSLDLIKFLYGGLKKCLMECRPNIIHVQYMTPGATIILLLRYVFNHKKIITTAHTTADLYSNLYLIHFIQRYCTCAFTCITERAERSFFGNSQLYSPELKLKKRGNHFTIYNNLPSYIAISDKPRQFNTPVTIGVVSRLERIKGMDLVVPAFAKVHARFPDSRLLVAGDGGLRSVMEEQVRENSLDEVVEFVGRQPQSALQSVYDRIDILLMPSRSEGFGLTAIEGMARGCAVVAADVGGLPEVVGGVGLLHKPEDIDDLAQKIECLLTDESRLGECSEAARKHVTRFSSETYSRLIADLYAKLSN